MRKHEIVHPYLVNFPSFWDNGWYSEETKKKLKKSLK
jgi:hypothetical protein